MMRFRLLLSSLVLCFTGRVAVAESGQGVITSASDSLPQLVLLIDKSRSMNLEGRLKFVKEAVAEFVAKIPNNMIRISIIGFDSNPFIVIKSTELNESSRAMIENRIKLLFPVSSTNIVSAIEAAVKEIDSPSKGRAAIFLIGDDWHSADYRDRNIKESVKEDIGENVKLVTFSLNPKVSLKPLSDMVRGKDNATPNKETLKAALDSEFRAFVH